MDPKHDALEEACDMLIRLMRQKTAGQEKYRKAGDVSFSDVDAIVNSIVIEAVALRLSGDLGIIKEARK